jgi:FkbM family methyltransferase
VSKVFVDLGAHFGETLGVVMEDRWGFDRIYCFEPAPQCWPKLDALADERVSVFRYGLWSSNDHATLFDPGRIGASLFDQKSKEGTSVDVELRDAAEWFAEHLDASDEVVMKVNCEGAECEILNHLCASGELRKVDEMVVHFDVRKVPGQGHREAETKRLLDEAGVPYRTAESIFFGGNIPEKTTNWLSWYHARGVSRLRYSLVRRIEYVFRVPAYRLRERLRARPGRA